MSGILDNFEILQASITAKYHIQVMLLFVYNGRLEIYLLYTEDLYSSQLKKQTQASAFLTIFLH